MDQNTLHLFARQLAHWATEIIEEGRFPFRKVETFPPLITERGELCPPLVFWVNKPSFMAGGFLIFPKSKAEEGIEMGRLCAQALGLRHFVTWAPKEVVFWEDRNGTILRHKTIPLETSSDNETESFQRTLRQIMDELKPLSVMGAIAPDRLSPFHLANLCHGTLKYSNPVMLQAYRAARGENRLSPQAPPSTVLASQKGILTLLRLLSLILHDQLPTTVQPEGLERAMQFALDTLPEALQEALKIDRHELPLPSRSGVHFHHLFRRLTQLQCGKNKKRITEILNILLDCYTKEMGGFPLPFALPENRSRTLLINANHLCPKSRQTIEVAPAPLLALKTLLRTTQNLPLPIEQKKDLFSVASDTKFSTILGTLTNAQTPARQQRKGLDANLRLSWPARYFRMPPNTPYWAWEFLHLLGLADDNALIELDTPANWLTAEYGRHLLTVIKEQFTLERLSFSSEGTIKFRLCKTTRPEAVTVINANENTRQIPWQSICEQPPSFLALALFLPDNLFDLLQQGVFEIPSEKNPPRGKNEAVYFFGHSSVGRFFWELLTHNRALPQRKAFCKDFLEHGIPLPSMETLENLSIFAWEKGGELPPQDIVDNELSRCLGKEKNIYLPKHPSATTKPQKTTSAKKPTSQGKMANQVIEAVFADGLPRFPEHYLYDYFRPQLQEYTIRGPMKLGEAFLGNFEVSDDQGNVLTVEGEETALALVLASFTNNGQIKLPKDRQLTATLVNRYIEDLKKMRRNLWRETHSRQADPKDGDLLARKIWKNLSLPPEKYIEK